MLTKLSRSDIILYVVLFILFYFIIILIFSEHFVF